MSDERTTQPFKSLGERLKTIRQKLNESVADVSGAVEIDEHLLERIEQGSERPSEDILLLLISHFGMRDDEAASLWQLAGYDPPRPNDDLQDELKNDRNLVLVMAVDPRVVYSDGVQVQATDTGVVINFAQGMGTNRQLTTARVGMSREQAQNVLRAIHDALQNSEPRQLPSGPTAPATTDEKSTSTDKPAK